MIAKKLIPMIASVFALLVLTESCTKSDNQPDRGDNPATVNENTTLAAAVFPSTIYFKSGFDGTTARVLTDDPAFPGYNPSVDNLQIEDLTGAENGYNWQSTLQSGPWFDGFRINYEGGLNTDRRADLLNDPTGGTNKVMRYWINNATIPGDRGILKGRIQSDLTNKRVIPATATAPKAREYYHKVRMFLPDSYDLIKNAALPAQYDSWINFFEYWDAAGTTNQFRIAIDLAKPTSPGVAGDPLLFKIKAQKVNASIQFIEQWPSVNTSFPIPIGQWFTAEVYIKQGTGATGIFYFSVTPSISVYNANPDLNLTAGVRKELTINNWTYSSSNAAPDGIEDTAPMKLYCSKDMVDILRPSGGMKVYWDDIELRFK